MNVQLNRWCRKEFFRYWIIGNSSGMYNDELHLKGMKTRILAGGFGYATRKGLN